MFQSDRPISPADAAIPHKPTIVLAFSVRGSNYYRPRDVSVLFTSAQVDVIWCDHGVQAALGYTVSVQNCDTLTLFKSRFKAHFVSSVYAS